MKYDIAIIGGGPAGYTAAERAAANGLQTVLFEKKAIGGVCLNEGCIPTKTLLYSAKLWDNMKGASKYGISVPDGSSFDMKKIIDRKDKVVKKLTGGVKMTVGSYGVAIVEKEAVIAGEENGMFRIVAGGETSGAVVSRLGVRALRIGETIAPGVPWTETLLHPAQPDAPHLALALKSGNFGGEDFFMQALGLLANAD